MKKKSLLIMGLLASSFFLGCTTDSDPEIVCIEGARACNTAGNATVCKGNAIVEVDMCIVGEQVCSQGVCVKKSVCDLNNPITCEGDRVRYCNSAGQYSYTDCASVNKRCEVVGSSATCVANPVIVCTEGATQCPIGAIKKLKTCVENAWVVSDCDEGLVCSSGKCDLPPACKEKAAKCTPEGQRQVCTDSVWVETPCASGEVCEGVGICKKPVPCKNDAVRCNGKVAQLCVDKLWTLKKVCDGATPECFAGECVAGPKYKAGDNCTATPNLDICELNRSTTCVDGKIDVLDCGEYKETCITLKSGKTDCGATDVSDVCKIEGDTYTFGNESICEDFVGDKPVVTFGLCHLIDGVLYGVETYNSKGFCTTFQDSKVGIVSCEGTKYVTSVCDGACNFINDVPLCGCKEGSKKCDGSKVLACTGGKWVDSVVCTTDQVCSTDKCINKSDLIGTACVAASFSPFCFENKRILCTKSKVAATDCGGDTCVILGDKKPYCGETTTACTKVGDRYLKKNGEGADMTCTQSDGYVYFGDCQDVGGKLYGMPSLSKGICLGADRISCNVKVKEVETCTTSCKEAGGTATCTK